VSTALVLAGGGLTGIAWETGLLLGLRDQGVDLVGTADLVVGTSAGATVGAQVLSRGTDLADLYDRQLSDEHGEITPVVDMDRVMAVMATGVGVEGGPPDAAARAAIGAVALSAETVDEAVRRAVIAGRLPSHEWPAHPLLVTAVDAVSGELAVFDAGSGVGLVEAVAASCAVPAVWPPVTIGDRRYVDGGVRTMANADLAAGHETVVVLAPMPGASEAALGAEVAALEAGGARVTVVVADEAALAAMGPNPLDAAFRRPAAEEGRRQGRGVAVAGLG
jgi:NTE family protein